MEIRVVEEWWPSSCRVIVDRVIDGDTVVVLMPLVFQLVMLRWPIRLEGINTPELRRGDESHRAMGRECATLLEQTLSTAPDEHIHMVVSGCDSFGRLIAKLYKIGDGTILDVNKFILDHGPGTVVYEK